MKRESKTVILACYLKEQKKVFICILICLTVFGAIFTLYHVPLESIKYAGLLCIVFLLVFIFFDFYTYQKRHVKRKEAEQYIAISLKSIEEPKSLVEIDYQRLLERLNTEKSEIINKQDYQYCALKEYVTLWTHQIKTPLTAANLILQQDNIVEDELKQLKHQHMEIEHYIDNILQYMRLDIANSDFLLEEYPIYPIVKEAVKYFSKTFILKRISLDLMPMEEVIVTDEKWLLFVMKQILSNALKYTQEGRVSIYTKSETKVSLVIEDTGSGIASEDLPRIFEQAFTGYNGHMNKKATGIGLFLSKEILEKLNHNIEITSKLEQGTKVTITF